MGWVRVSDDYYEDHKFDDLSFCAEAVWFRALAYSNSELKDGILTYGQISRLIEWDDEHTPASVRKELTQALWHEDGHSCDACAQPGTKKIVIHRYLDYQPSRETVRGEKDKKSIAGRLGAAKRWTTSDGDYLTKLGVDVMRVIAQAEALHGAIKEKHVREMADRIFIRMKQWPADPTAILLHSLKRDKGEWRACMAGELKNGDKQ